MSIPFARPAPISARDRTFTGEYVRFATSSTTTYFFAPLVALPLTRKKIFMFILSLLPSHTHILAVFSQFFPYLLKSSRGSACSRGVRTQMIAIKFEYLLWGQATPLRFILFVPRSVRSFCGTRCCCGWLCFFALRLALIHSAKGKRNKFVAGRLV